MTAAPSQQGQFRYERKFLVAGLDHETVNAVVRLHPAIFLESYPDRYINNIYLDSANRSSLRQAIEGERDRMKVRVRWYGEIRQPIAKPVLELKIKRGLLGTKVSFPLASFRWDRDFRPVTLRQVFLRSDLPPSLLQRLSLLEPALVNRYYRSYRRSADRNFRITIDSQLEFFSPIAYPGTFPRSVVDRENTVLEVKYDQSREPAAQEVTRHLPFRLTKSSKYVMGLERLEAF